MSIQERVRQEQIREALFAQFSGAAQALAQSAQQAGLREQDIKGFAKVMLSALKPSDALIYVKRRATKHGQWNAIAPHFLDILEQVRKFAHEQHNDIAAQTNTMYEFINLVHGMYIIL